MALVKVSCKLFPGRPRSLVDFHTGRDCSGRGLCDYDSGLCKCFSGYYGTKCQIQTVLG